MISDATKQPFPIFVYGTLIMGQPNDTIWQKSILRVEEATFNGGILYDVGAYPIMVEKEGHAVVGQIVYVIKERYTRIMDDLDFLEGFDPQHAGESTFQRVLRPVQTFSGGSASAWTYVGIFEQVCDLPLIESGDWRKHVSGKGPDIAAWWKTK